MSIEILVSKIDYKEDNLDTSFIVDESDVFEDDFELEAPVELPEGYSRPNQGIVPKEIQLLVEDELISEDERDDDFECTESHHDSEDDMVSEEEDM